MSSEDAIPTAAPSEPSDGQRMAVAAVAVTVILAAGRAVGSVKQLLVAYYFGVSAAADMLNIIYDVVVFRSYASIEQLVRPAYLPVFVRMKQQDESAAWRLTSILTTVAFLILSAAVAAVAVFAPDLIRVLWPQWARDEAVLRQAVGLLRVMAPAVVFLSLSVLPELTLHSYKRFIWPAVVEGLYRLCAPVAMVVLIGLVWQRNDPSAVYALAVGVALGGSARFFLMLPALRDKVRLFRPSARAAEPIAVETYVLMLPVLVGVIFSVLRGYIESRVATDIGAGTYASLKYARVVVDIPVQVLPLAVSFVVFPYLTEYAGQGARDKMADALVSMTRALAFLFVPCAVAIILMTRPVVELLYLRGKFGPEDVHPTAMALLCFAPGLLFYAVEGSINKWFFALKDTVTPNVVGIGCVFVHIAIAIVGTYVLHGGVMVLALAYSVSKSLKVLILYLLIKPRIGPIAAGPVFVYVGKLAVACAAMSAGILGAQVGLTHVLGPGKLVLLGCVAAGVVAFLIGAAAVRIEELYLVTEYLLGKVKKRLRRPSA